MTESGDKAQAIDAKTVYNEVGLTYRYFLDWRNKIVAGYLAVLGALGFGYANVHSAARQIALLLAAGGVSFAFWIFDFRNRELFWACQAAGARLEKAHGLQGPYSALDSVRFGTKHRLTHGLAVNLMVVGVITAVVCMLTMRVPTWLRTLPHPYKLTIGGCVLLLLLIVWVEWWGGRGRHELKRTSQDLTK